MIGRASRARLGALTTVVALLAPAMWTTGPAVAASDPCPNAAIRAQQGATHLPDCRAYELVTPARKGGAAFITLFAVRPAGDMVGYKSIGAFPGTPSNLASNYLARRSDDGWTATSHNPPTLGRNAWAYDEWLPAAVSDDFSRLLIDTAYPVDPDDQGAPNPSSVFSGSADLYRSELDGSFTWIAKGKTLPDLAPDDVIFDWASPSLDRILFDTRRPLTDEIADARYTHIYAYTPEGLELLSIGVDGRPMPAGARLGDGTQRAGVNGVQFGGAAARAVSDNGDTIAFTAADGVNQVWVRIGLLNPARAVTKLVSRSAIDGRASPTAATFISMSRDGGTVLFSSSSQLTADATTNGGIYAFDVATEQVTFLTPAIAGNPTSGLRYMDGDRDLDYVYFISNGQLTADAPTTGPKLYALHDGAVRLIAAGRNTSVMPGNRETMVTPDGSRLVFAARIELDPTRNGGGLEQLFLYDAETGAIRCVSCRSDGSPTASVAGFNDIGAGQYGGDVPIGNLSPDGKRVYFTTSDALVPADVNGVADAYVWIDGEHHLLTNGTDPYPSIFAGASADGTDVLIGTYASLVPEDIDDGETDLYNVRVNGGFPVKAAAGCDTDCQGPLRALDAPSLPGTFTFVGPGDELERPAPRTTAVFSVAPLGPGKRAAWARRGRVTLRVRVSHAGMVSARVHTRGGKRVLVAAARKRAGEGGTVRLRLRLSPRARRALRANGSLRLVVTVRYSRVRGAQRAAITLRAPGARAARTGAGR